MAQRMGGITCDQCGIIVDNQDVFIMRRSKKGTMMHFCSKECLNKKPVPKDPAVDISKFITDEQAAEFIHESNAIEEIHYDKELALREWKFKDSNVPELRGKQKLFVNIIP